MKKNYKRIYAYAIVMLLCVLAIVLIACLSENRLDSYRTEYEQMLSINEKKIISLEEDIVELSEKNAELEEKAKEAERLLSDIQTGQQALSDMTDIFDLWKAGKKSDARQQFSKIETAGFDDANLAYYELLDALLNK